MEEKREIYAIKVKNHSYYIKKGTQEGWWKTIGK